MASSALPLQPWPLPLQPWPLPLQPWPLPLQSWPLPLQPWPLTLQPWPLLAPSALTWPRAQQGRAVSSCSSEVVAVAVTLVLLLPWLILQSCWGMVGQ